VSGYLKRLEAEVRSWRRDPRLWIMQSNGGVTSAARAAELPVTLLLSGPAGGAVAGGYVASQVGLENAITIDMGGTSFDVCLLAGKELPMTQERKVLDLPVEVPSVDILTVGAGGGSLAWMDRGGQFRVGPHSAGAYPGPAVYGRGGSEATVTDANVVFGLLGEGQSLADEVQLDVGAAHRACQALGQSLGMSTIEVAWGILRIVNATMAGAVRAVSVGRGHDPRDFAMIGRSGAPDQCTRWTSQRRSTSPP
jgi:N-methylhydantoinase A